MTYYVKVVPTVKIPWAKNQFFTYKAEGKLKIGQEVIVSFRKQEVRGIVWGLSKQKPNFPTKEIKTVVDPNPVLSKTGIKLAQWISGYYYCALGLAVKLLLPRRVQSRKKAPKKPEVSSPRVRLTPKQKEVLGSIKKSRKHFFLLHGVTGSGKTEIYLRLCQDVLAQGKQAIILVPEISLTHQMIDRFSARFPGKAAVIHSRLTGGERFVAWRKIASAKAKVVIGPRSAIFAPIQNLGLIVLDEEHDSSFKQYDQTPRYHAREVAFALGKLTHAKIILGSATPTVVTYFKALEGKLKLLELPQRIGKDKMPQVEIVDMRQEFREGHRALLSRVLGYALEQTISQKKQAILFVNRRGAATFVFCQDCGYALRCPNCDTSLTYHLGPASHLLCHYCNFKTERPAFCPVCKSPHLKYFGIGTQRVEAEVKNLLPKARVSRFDRDATKRRQGHKKIYYDFLNHKIDVLIGTQMLAQGWDLPKVALIGIISADPDLNLPDFRATERTFTLLTQVAGRTGRGRERGKVILQTYNPDNPAIQAAASHHYKLFFEKEIQNRKELSFPPFSTVVMLLCQGYKKETVERKSRDLAQRLKNIVQRKRLEVTLLGPAPGFIPRIRRRYRYQIILMFKPRAQKAKSVLLSQVPPDWIIDVDPESLL